VNNTCTNFYPIVHHLQAITDYWSNFWCQRGMLLFNAVIHGEVLHSGLQNLVWRS